MKAQLALGLLIGSLVTAACGGTTSGGKAPNSTEIAKAQQNVSKAQTVAAGLATPTPTATPVPTATPLPTSLYKVSIRNTDAAGGRFTVKGVFRYQDGSLSPPDSQTSDILSGQTNVVTFTGAARRPAASFDYEVTPPTKMVPRTVAKQVPLTYTTQGQTANNRSCGFLFADRCTQGQLTVINTDSAGGFFTVVGNFAFTDNTTASQTKSVNLLSGQSQLVQFDELRGKTMRNYDYKVTAPTKTVSEIVQDQVPVSFVSDKSESLLYQ